MRGNFRCPASLGVQTELMSAQPGEFFLFLGNSDSESATTRVRAGGGFYQIKRLNSGPDNWQKIVELVSSPSNQGTVATLTGNDYALMVSSSHAAVAEQLLDALADRPHVIFVHSAVYLTPEQRAQTRFDAEPEERLHVDVHRRFDDEDYFGMPRDEFFGEVPQEVREQVNMMMAERGLNVLPYQSNVERSILATAFLDDHERNLLFRVYVPSGRLFAAEADTLVRLFQDWLNTTGQGDIRLDGYRTHAGQVFEFFSGTPQPVGGLSRQFQKFSDFLDRCVDAPDAAASDLAGSGIDPLGADLVVARFATAAKRLRLDLEQRREERLLVLKHSFEVDNARS